MMQQIINRKAAVLLLALAPLFAAAADPVRKAQNADPEILIRTGDYLSVIKRVPEFEAIKRAIRTEQLWDRITENWPTADRVYHFDYQHASRGGIVLTSYLSVAPSDEEARRIEKETLGGTLEGFNRKGIELRTLPGSADWAPAGRYYSLILNGQIRGNFFLVRQRQNVVAITLVAPYALGDKAAVMAFLAPKLPFLLAFVPVFSTNR